MKETAAPYGTAPGVWMSPWGGYGKPKQQRVAAGKAAGYEIVDNGFALSGPKYYAGFRDACVKFVRDYGVNQFKFDGTGNADRVVPGSTLRQRFCGGDSSDWRIARAEARPLRQPDDGYLSFAILAALCRLDLAGRRGSRLSGRGFEARAVDHLSRCRHLSSTSCWRGRLFPLNSLMLHGIIYARTRTNLDTDPQSDFKNEVRDYFGNGTQLQEMYITPSLLSQADWDTLAEAAAWSRANADVLVDTHWIGGDPALLEVYGWASWNPQKAVLVLRNPSDKPQTIHLDIAKAFELPPRSARAYTLHSPWREDRGQASIRVAAGQPHAFSLQPFQVLVLEGGPVE